MTVTRRIAPAAIVIGLMALSFVAGVGFEGRFHSLSPRSSEFQVAQFPGDVFADEAALQALQAKDARNLTPVEVFWQVLSKVRQKYYQPIDDESKLAYGAADGLMAALGDPYSRFLDPKDLESFSRQTQGSLEGIGAVLAPGDTKKLAGGAASEDIRTVVILRPFAGGPADKVGILPGDWIVGVGQSEETIESVVGQTVEEVANKIRGPHGTKVYLRIVRGLDKEPLVKAVPRERVEVPVVESKRFGDVEYVRLDSFNEHSFERLSAALTDLDKQPGKSMVIDLRGNPGGLLDVAIRVVSLFVPEGPVVYVQEREGTPEEKPVDHQLYRGYTFPIAVLTNAETASAAEILSGALRDNKRATLVGTTTFGKGLVQTVIPMADNRTALSITTARYLTPSKTDINKTGIVPDYYVPVSRDEEVQLLRGELAPENDKQLQAALAFLRDGKVPQELLGTPVDRTGKPVAATPLGGAEAGH